MWSKVWERVIRLCFLFIFPIISFALCHKEQGIDFPFGDEIQVACKTKKTHESFCNCLRPHKSNFINGDEILAKKIGESFSKEFEKNMRSILKTTSFLQHKVTNNYSNNSGASIEIEERLSSAKSCRMDKLTSYLEDKCNNGTIYSLLKKTKSEFSLSSLLSRYKKEINSRESKYIAVDSNKCSGSYRCEFKSSCDLSDLDAEVLGNDFQVYELKNFLSAIATELSQTNDVEAAVKLALSNKRLSKDIAGYRFVKDKYKAYKNKFTFKEVFDQGNEKIVSMISQSDGLTNFLNSKEQILSSLDNIENSCSKTYEVYKNVMCQSVDDLSYDFSDMTVDAINKEYNDSVSDLSGSFATCGAGDKLLSTDLQNFRSNLSAEEVLAGSAEKLSVESLKNNAHKVRSLLCENIPSSDKKLKKQIKELNKKIESSCIGNKSTLLKYLNTPLENTKEKEESCAYLKSYRRMLEAKEQTKSFVKKNNSFKDYLKTHPSSTIKSEEEYIEKIGAPSVAKSLLLGGDEDVSEPVEENLLPKLAQNDKKEDSNAADSASEPNQSTDYTKSKYTFKKAPASVKSTKEVRRSNSNFIAPPKGLTFKYKGPSKSEISKDIEDLRKNIANEKQRQKEILEIYNNSSLEEQKRIDSQFDLIDSSYNTASKSLSSDDIDQFIEDERLIDSGLKSPSRGRTIASAELSNFIGSADDPYRETINNDIFTKDRIDLVDQNVGSSEKIDAFGIELGPNGYEIQKLIVSGSIEKDLSLVYDRDPNKSIVDKISRSSASQSEQVQKYKKLLQSKKDFLISKNSELDIEVIVRYNFNLQKHEVSPFVGNLNDEFYLKNKVEYNQLKDQVQKSIDEGDFRALSQI